MFEHLGTLPVKSDVCVCGEVLFDRSGWYRSGRGVGAGDASDAVERGDPRLRVVIVSTSSLPIFAGGKATVGRPIRSSIEQRRIRADAGSRQLGLPE